MGEHVNATDPDIHEPKGVSTANSGDVYVADGAGSGAWGQSVSEYANIYTQKSDSVTLSSIGTTVQTLPFSTDGAENGAVADSSNNRLTLTTAGDYKVDFHISMATAAAGDAGLYSFVVLDDGVVTPLESDIELSGTTDTTVVSVSGVITVGAGSQLTVRIASDEAGNTDDIEIYNAQLSALLLKAT